MMQVEPFFLTNPDWYYFDEDAWKYKLTDKAPAKAKQSYKEFYADEPEEREAQE